MKPSTHKLRPKTRVVSDKLHLGPKVYRESIMGAPANGIHPCEFVFQKSRAMASDLCGIKTHGGGVLSARAPMVNSISTTMGVWKKFSYDVEGRASFHWVMSKVRTVI